METNDQIRQQLIYYLEKNSDLSETGFKVMKSHENIGFISCNYVYYNGKIKLIYNKRDLVSLYEIIPQITSEKYLEIVNNLFDLLIKIRDIGFLQYRNIIMSLERIYIDMNSYKVNVIYLPLNVTQDIEFRELERCLIGLLRQVGCNYQNICSQQYARFYELIKSDISIEMIKREMKTGDAIREIYQQQNNQFQQNNQLQYDIQLQQNSQLYQKEKTGFFGRRKKEKGETEFKVRVEDRATQILEKTFIPQIKLRYLGRVNTIEIVINKEEFLIGKQIDSVDFVLTISNAISRVHCKIVTVKDIAYIEDLKSSNGTCVNGRRLLGNERVPLGQGDKIMIANQEFVVMRI